MKRIMVASIMVALFVSSFLLSPAVYAGEDHSLSNITGANIELKNYDHAFAGSIKDFVAWGFMDESTGIARLRMRKYGQTIKAEFKKQPNGNLGGIIISENLETKVYFVEGSIKGVGPTSLEFSLNINNKNITVNMAFQNYADGHFKSTNFTTALQGEKVSYTMEGSACLGLSISYTMMILGAYAH